MNSVENNYLAVKKEKLTGEQKKVIDDNYKEAVNVGDKAVKISRNNPFATREDILKELVNK